MVRPFSLLSWKQLSFIEVFSKNEIENGVENSTLCIFSPPPFSRDRFLSSYTQIPVEAYVQRVFFSVCLIFPIRKIPLMAFCFQIFLCFCEVIIGFMWSVIVLWLQLEWKMSFFIFAWKLRYTFVFQCQFIEPVFMLVLITESQNYRGWERPPKSSSPTSYLPPIFPH